jgi:hypothetical protein
LISLVVIKCEIVTIYFFFDVQTKAELLKKAELKRKEAVKQQELLINSKQVSISA